VTLKLRPDALGELTVRISVKGATVDARLRASTAEAHRLLEQSVESLRAALETRGLQAGRIEVEPTPHGTRPEAAPAQPHEPSSGAETQVGDEGSGDAPQESAPEREFRGGAAVPGGDPQDEGSSEAWTLGSAEHPGVVYGVADGAARVVMVDALA